MLVLAGIEPAEGEPAELQVKAAEIALIAMWKDISKSWVDIPRVLCVGARLERENRPPEEPRDLPQRSIDAIQAAVGAKSTVRGLTICRAKMTRYGLKTATGESAWILTYADADEIVAEHELRTNAHLPTWQSRNSFNSNLVVESPPTPGLQPYVGKAGRLLFDGLGSAEGRRGRSFSFDFTSSDGEIWIYSQTGLDIIE
jgi:hypothetical protein